MSWYRTGRSEPAPLRAALPHRGRSVWWDRCLPAKGVNKPIASRGRVAPPEKQKLDKNKSQTKTKVRQKTLVCLQDALDVAIKMSLSIPLPDILAYRKVVGGGRA